MTAAVALYIPVYLFKAMRRVYAQGFFVTGFKYSLLNIAYLICLVITVLATFVVTALTL